jgi:hypothetical protein
MNVGAGRTWHHVMIHAFGCVCHVDRRAILFRPQSPQGMEAIETFENIMQMLYDPKSLSQQPVFERLLAQHQRSRARNLLPAWSGILGQLCAVHFHHVSIEHLQRLRHAKFGKLVIGVTQDHLVRPANSRFLAAALGVPLYVVCLPPRSTLPMSISVPATRST